MGSHIIPVSIKVKGQGHIAIDFSHIFGVFLLPCILAFLWKKMCKVSHQCKYPLCDCIISDIMEVKGQGQMAILVNFCTFCALL